MQRLHLHEPQAAGTGESGKACVGKRRSCGLAVEIQTVIAIPAGDGISLISFDKVIIAIATHQGVRARTPLEVVIGGATDQGIVTGIAIEIGVERR